MKQLIAILCCTITLTACANQPVPANRPNSDIRTINGMGLFGGNVAQAAARACDNENKKLNILSTTTQTGATGTSYPVIVFKCE